MDRHDPPTHHGGIVNKCQKSRRSLIDPLAFYWGGSAGNWVLSSRSRLTIVSRGAALSRRSLEPLDAPAP